LRKEIVEIQTIQTGQPRPHADSIYEAFISIRCEGVLRNEAIFYRSLNEDLVKKITQILFRSYKEKPENVLDSRLEICKSVGPTPEMIKIAHPKWEPKHTSRWLVRVVVPYCD
jgi:hypothetical protein